MSDDPSHAVEHGGSFVRVLRESFLTGIAVTAPALVTLYLLSVAIDFLLRFVRPVSRVVLLYVVPSVDETLADAGTGLALVVFIFAIGFVAHFHAGKLLFGRLDTFVMRVPIVGTVYESLRRMSDAVFGTDQQSFRDVVLVELPSSETHMLGFRIGSTPEEIASAGDIEDAQTLFVPLAPNPVMAGFLVHVAESNIHEVDITVEEGVSAIVSLGTAEDVGSQPGLTTVPNTW